MMRLRRLQLMDFSRQATTAYCGIGLNKFFGPAHRLSAKVVNFTGRQPAEIRQFMNLVAEPGKPQNLIMQYTRINSTVIDYVFEAAKATPNSALLRAYEQTCSYYLDLGSPVAPVAPNEPNDIEPLYIEAAEANPGPLMDDCVTTQPPNQSSSDLIDFSKQAAAAPHGIDLNKFFGPAHPLSAKRVNFTGIKPAEIRRFMSLVSEPGKPQTLVIQYSRIDSTVIGYVFEAAKTTPENALLKARENIRSAYRDLVFNEINDSELRYIEGAEAKLGPLTDDCATTPSPNKFNEYLNELNNLYFKQAPESVQRFFALYFLYGLTNSDYMQNNSFSSRELPPSDGFLSSGNYARNIFKMYKSLSDYNDTPEFLSIIRQSLAMAKEIIYNPRLLGETKLYFDRRYHKLPSCDALYFPRNVQTREDNLRKLDTNLPLPKGEAIIDHQARVLRYSDHKRTDPYTSLEDWSFNRFRDPSFMKNHIMGSRVLEVGSGVTGLIKEIRSFNSANADNNPFCQAIGIDLETKPEDPYTINMNVFDIQFPDGVFDVVTETLFFKYLEDMWCRGYHEAPQVPRELAFYIIMRSSFEIHRVLKPGGLLINRSNPSILNYLLKTSNITQ